MLLSCKSFSGLLHVSIELIYLCSWLEADLSSRTSHQCCAFCSPDESNGQSAGVRTPSLYSGLSDALTDTMPRFSSTLCTKELAEPLVDKLSINQQDEGIPVDDDSQFGVEDQPPINDPAIVEHDEHLSADSEWKPSHPRIDDGSSRAKRVAVKLLSKVALREKPEGELTASRKAIRAAPKTDNQTTLVGRFLKRKGKCARDTKTVKNHQPRRLKNIQRSHLEDSEEKLPDLEAKAGEDCDEMDSGGLKGNGVDAAASVDETASQSPQGSKHSTDGIESTQSSTSAFQVNSQKISSGLFRRSGSSLTCSESAPLDFESSTVTGNGRHGVFLKLKAENLELVGERGSRVPNMVVKELSVEVECALSVDVEYSERKGWEFDRGLSLEIISLKKKAIGNTLPLPSGLIRTILNLILPKVRHLTCMRLRFNRPPEVLGHSCCTYVWLTAVNCAGPDPLHNLGCVDVACSAFAGNESAYRIWRLPARVWK